MNTYVCEYKMLDDSSVRDNCMTLFGGMSVEDDKKDLGNVSLLGRWSVVGEARGFCVAQADNCEDLQKWLMNWVPMGDIKVMPCLDDNQQRELILGKEPEFKTEYKTVNSKAKENESLYFVKYKFKCGKRKEGFDLFSTLTEEMDKNDSGKCTSYGRWHVPSQGCGCAIASSPSVLDMYKWAFNWDSLCDCEIIPVTEDVETRNIIKSKPDFSVKHKKLMNVD